MSPRMGRLLTHVTFRLNPICHRGTVADPVRQGAGLTLPQHSITMTAEDRLTEDTAVRPARRTATVTEALVASTTMIEHHAIVRPPGDRWKITRRLEAVMRSLTAATIRHLPTLMQTVVDQRMIGHQENFPQENQHTPAREGMRVITIVAGATGKFYSLFCLLSQSTHHGALTLCPLPPVFLSTRLLCIHSLSWRNWP